ncbi:PhzF family phenazine biosynthesis protein [Kitasatospora sp. NPDC101235]|uniref:PhzF family phenazine biosynthesis protein n=1 Tax=Kitasatospora sp. NPDC101235 TaxID=3364101 RepID=UPI00380CB493
MRIRLVDAFTDETTVRNLSPDLAALTTPALRDRRVVATAVADNPEGAYQFVSRCFFPAIGIGEDPVTGSTHTALDPYWSARLGRDDLTARRLPPRPAAPPAAAPRAWAGGTPGPGRTPGSGRTTGRRRPVPGRGGDDLVRDSGAWLRELVEARSERRRWRGSCDRGCRGRTGRTRR